MCEHPLGRAHERLGQTSILTKKYVLSSRTSKKLVQRQSLEVQIAQDSHVLLCQNGF